MRRICVWSVLRGAAALAFALAQSGCCSLAQLLCGPDRSQWVSVAYDSPEQALATFLEAIRRDRPKEIYASLSDGFRTKSGLPGAAEATLAWERLRQQTPGLHLLGSAQTEPGVPLPDGGVRFRLELSGQECLAEFAPQGLTLVRYRTPYGIEEHSVHGAPDFALTGQGAESVATVRLQRLSLPEDLLATDVVDIRVAYTWKVRDLIFSRVPQAPPSLD